MRDLMKPILLIAAALLVPILPFVAFGPALEKSMDEKVQGELPPATAAAITVAALAADIFLPVPSSVVATMAGRVLGVAAGTAAAWLGMTLGTVLGFGLARTLGRPLALRFAGAQDLERIDRLASRLGPAVVVVARPIPVLAEASVLFLGATRMAWRPFLAAAALSNLGIAAAYASLGTFVRLPIALAGSIALPMVATLVARRLWPAVNAGRRAEP